MASFSLNKATDGPSGDWIAESPEVFYLRTPLAIFGPAEIARLKHQAMTNPRRRARLCTHAGKEDALHEMLIVHHREVYVRPHLHIGRRESLHVVEGEAELVLFDTEGALQQVINVGTAATGRSPYCRIPEGVYHTLLFTSEWFVFHEVIPGPFDPTRSTFAPWAPMDGEMATIFQDNLRNQLAGFLESTS
jgi:cupin fold WbuC family metalloprotein